MGCIIIAFVVASRLGPFVGDTLLTTLGLDELIQPLIDISKTTVNIPYLDTANDANIVEDYVNLFVNSIGAIIVFFVVRYGISLLLFTTSVINKIPIIGRVNKFAGGVLGLIKGLILSVLLVWILSFVAVESVENFVSSSYMASFILDSFPNLYQRLLEMLANI